MAATVSTGSSWWADMILPKKKKRPPTPEEQAVLERMCRKALELHVHPEVFMVDMIRRGLDQLEAEHEAVT